jgi:hypothetical protein
MLLAAALLAPVLMAVTPAAAFAANCGQATHVWWATPNGSLANGSTVNLPNGTVAFMTGVVTPNTAIIYDTPDGLFDINGSLTHSIGTTGADGNCVVHHQDNPITVRGSGRVSVFATYGRWEDGTQVRTFVGFVNVT